MSANAEIIKVESGEMPRLGFLEAERPTRFRTDAFIHEGIGETKAVNNPGHISGEMTIASAYEAVMLGSSDELLEMQVDGLVISPRNASYAKWIVPALERHIPVFCQKPLMLTGIDVRRIVDAAREHDCLLAMDFPYRHIKGISELREHIRRGELGDIHALDLTFHYGTGMAKFLLSNPDLRKNGYLVDMSFHLIDLALWLLDYPRVVNVKSYAISGNVPEISRPDKLGDYALAKIHLADGATVRVGYSQRSSCDTVIDMEIYGSCRGDSVLKSMNEFLFNFVVGGNMNACKINSGFHHDTWINQSLIEWVMRLNSVPGFDPGIEKSIYIADIIDRVYGR